MESGPDLGSLHASDRLAESQTIVIIHDAGDPRLVPCGSVASDPKPCHAGGRHAERIGYKVYLGSIGNDITVRGYGGGKGERENGGQKKRGRERKKRKKRGKGERRDAEAAAPFLAFSSSRAVFTF